ncbi:MAG: hypothetical protein IE922_11370 [Sphingomonadales bacterium]|nr:hypothetical protein [Sphingomonadales bacterium]
MPNTVAIPSAVPGALPGLIDVQGDLVLAALCVGQFRAPCQIEADRLFVQADEALVQALRALGLTLQAANLDSFTPAPLFAPDPGFAAREARRHAHIHVSRQHDDEALDENEAPGANA